MTERSDCVYVRFTHHPRQWIPLVVLSLSLSTCEAGEGCWRYPYTWSGQSPTRTSPASRRHIRVGPIPRSRPRVKE